MEDAMFVKEIMSSNVEWASPDLSLQEVAKTMRDQEIGCLPVKESEDGKLVGLITDRDIACRGVADGRDYATTTVKDIMSEGITCCFDDQDITDAAHLMEEKKVQRLPVLNRDNTMVGILSIADLATRASNQLSGGVLQAVSKQGR
jgi:CBS domain-containing protein